MPQHVIRPLAEKKWPQIFRTYKSTLRALLNNGDTTEVQPRGIDPDIWRKFVENENDPKKKEQRVKNNENKKKSEFSHCLGRRSYAQKQYQMVCIIIAYTFEFLITFYVPNSLHLNV